jgi:hypothetical protein
MSPHSKETAGFDNFFAFLRRRLSEERFPQSTGAGAFVNFTRRGVLISRELFWASLCAGLTGAIQKVQSGKRF